MRKRIVACAWLLAMLTACGPVISPAIPIPYEENGRVEVDSRFTSYRGHDNYWTDNHLRQAFVNGERVGKGGDFAPDKRLSPVQLGEGDPGVGYNFSGIPQLGTFFFRTGAGNTEAMHTCSGVVINSTTGTVVLSAAHCWYGLSAQSIVFIPQFSWTDKGPQAPYGVWDISADGIVIDPRYEASNLYDVAALVVSPNGAQQAIEEVTGSFDLKLDVDPVQSEIEIMGYPASESDDATYTAAYPRHCRNSTTEWNEDDVRYIYILCTGMASGISGGPWLARDGDTWVVVAVTGGGQDNGGYTDDESVGVRMSSHVTHLIEQAENFDPDSYRDWENARLMAGGRFGGINGVSDFIVLWNNGNMDLFFGSGQATSPLMGVSELISGSRGILTTRTITAADLDASGRDDLIVLKMDGTVTIYQDPESGISQGLDLNDHDILSWLGARQIAGGNFSPEPGSSNGHEDDLLVIDADGSASVYLHVAEHGLQRRLAWPIGGLAGLLGEEGGPDGELADGIDGVITSGNFGGGELTDLMVVARRKDGTRGAWLITDGPNEGRAPSYRLARYDLEDSGIDPEDVVAIAAGNFDQTGGGSDVMIKTRGSGMYLLSGVSQYLDPTPGSLTVISQ